MSQNNTKKIAVVAANGRVGSLVVAEAVRRGFDVTAIARSDNRTQAQHFLQGDALTIGREQLEGFDAVVDAVGGWTEDTLHKDVAAAAQKSLEYLRTRDDVRWTYVSPAADFQAEGERTGAYTLAGEELTLNEKGESVISYADYAIAMVDEIESGEHIRERISVVSK